MAISHLGTGSAVFGTNDITPGIPGTPAAGDMMLLLVGGKPFNATFGGNMAPGWNALSAFTDGSTAAGTDLGSMQVTAWWKEHDGSEADPLVDEGGTAWNIMGALVMVFRKGAGEVWETPVIVGGGDASAGTGFSVTTGAIALAAGDHTVTFGAFRSDAATPCSNHLDPSMAGITFSHTHDPATDPETISGGDMGMCVSRSTVDSGSANTTATLAATLAASHTGSAALIRLRAAAAPITITASPATLTLTASATTPTFGALANTVTPATLTLSASVTDPTPAALAVQSSPAALTLSAQTVDPTVAALAVQASPALLTFSASALNPITPRIIVTAPALLSFAASATDPTPAPLAVQSAPASLTLTAQTVTPNVGVIVAVSPAVLILTASPVQLPGQPIVVLVSPAALVIIASTTDPTLGAFVVTGSPATLTLTAQVVTAVLAAHQHDLTPAVLILAASVVRPQQGAQYRIGIRVARLAKAYQTQGAGTKWVVGSPSGHGTPTTLGGRWAPGSLRRHM